jgi:hypothetical protein
VLYLALYSQGHDNGSYKDLTSAGASGCANRRGPSRLVLFCNQSICLARSGILHLSVSIYAFPPLSSSVLSRYTKCCTSAPAKRARVDLRMRVCRGRRSILKSPRHFPRTCVRSSHRWHGRSPLLLQEKLLNLCHICDLLELSHQRGMYVLQWVTLGPGRLWPERCLLARTDLPDF